MICGLLMRFNPQRKREMTRFALLLCLCSSQTAAARCSVPEGAGRPINHANLFIEDNAGDGDIGVHGDFDDHGWSEGNPPIFNGVQS